MVDGERPLKFQFDIIFPFRKSILFIDQYPICFNGILKAFQEKKKIKFNFEKAKHSECGLSAFSIIRLGGNDRDNEGRHWF